MNASKPDVLGGIMGGQWPETPSTEQIECLRSSRSAIESSERLTAVGG